MLLVLLQRYKNLKSKKIYIIRHGQTDFNLNGIVQGSGIDSSLNETGKAQAALFYSKYKDYPFQKAYISVLKRTQESISQFVKDGINFEKTEALNEISWGEFDGKIDTKDKNSIYWEILNRWKSGDLKAKVEGAENPEEVRSRLLPFVSQLLASEHEEILICMHGRAMRVLLSMLTGKPLLEMDSFLHNNLCLYVLEQKGEELSIILENDISHLENIL